MNTEFAIIVQYEQEVPHQEAIAISEEFTGQISAIEGVSDARLYLPPKKSNKSAPMELSDIAQLMRKGEGTSQGGLSFTLHEVIQIGAIPIVVKFGEVAVKSLTKIIIAWIHADV